jgi:DNA polymerase/3'-5' exonuclease PolX
MRIEDILSGGSKRRQLRNLRGNRAKGVSLTSPIKATILDEGGKIFGDVTPFAHDKIPAIMQAINGVLSKAGTKAIPIGSSASPTPGKISGDLDIIVDQDQLAKSTNQEQPAAIKKALRAMYDQAGFQTGQSGVSVHVRVKIAGVAHQVDIMVVPKAKIAATFHTHEIPQGSKFKGVNKHIAMAALAKQKNMLWSPYQGLFSRDESGKKENLVTDDINEIARMLLGKSASSKDLGSMESIMALLGDQAGAQLLDNLRKEPQWKEQSA